MPGIVGCITRRPRHEAAAEVRKMTAAMLHEDFYVAGTWAEESYGVYFGWVARIGSFSEKMPVQTERQEVTLVFSGEEFPEPGTPQRLKAVGHELDEDGPSYVAHLYEEDPSFPAGLNGRFHGLLVDRSSGKVILFNDRY